MFRQAVLSLPLLLVLIAPASADDPAPRHFAADRTFDMKHIRLELDIDLKKTRVEGIATLDMNALTPSQSITLDAVDFELHDVSGRTGEESDLDNWPHRYDGEQLVIYPPRTLQRGDAAHVVIHYTVTDPSSGLHFFSPEENGPQAPYQVWSQGESIENRYWIPCFDHPNEMQSTEIIATVAAGNEVLSNGELVKREKTSDGRERFHWRQQKPHVVYLMTLVVGEFHVGREEWRNIPVTYYVPKDRADEVEPTFRNTIPMLDLFTDMIGVDYPWEKYAQICCYAYGGGMENTSATTLGERSLLDAHTRLDRSADGLIAHELAHQWFGDLVTCSDWAHLWLNEGFASYFEAIWDEHVHGPQALAYMMSEKARSARRGGTTLPIVHRSYDHPDDQFDARAYPKGAWVVHMLRRELGDELFWKTLKVYLETHAHQPVETADLRRVVERVSGRNFERFFYDWTARPGHPVVELEYRWMEEDKLARLRIEQTQKSEPFHFPLTIEFVCEDEAETVTLTREMTTKSEEYLIPLPFRPGRISVDPQQQVLMDLMEDKPRALWEAQLERDPNPVNRLAALRELGSRSRYNGLYARLLKSDTFYAVRRQLARELAEQDSDTARDALLAALKDEDHRVRRAAVDGLATFPDDNQVRAAIANISTDNSQSYAVQGAAIAALVELEVEDLLDRVKPLLQREDPRDAIRSAAIRALGETDELAAINLLLPYASDAHPSTVRREAVTALRKLSNGAKPEEPLREQVVIALAHCLEADSTSLKIRAANSLGNLKPAAVSALPKLQAVLDDAPRERVRTAVEEAIEKIEPAVAVKDEPDPAQDATAALRTQLEELQAKYEETQARLEELEALLNGYRSLLEQQRSDIGK